MHSRGSPARLPDVALPLCPLHRSALGWPFYSGKAEDKDKAQQPPEILTNKYWPVRQSILSNLSLSDKRALAQAFPGLEIQEDATYKRQEHLELVNKVEIISGLDVACYHSCDHSHFGHPLLKAIVEKERIRSSRKGWSGGSEITKKTQEINQSIANISEDINEIPAIGTELCLTVAPYCWIRGYTALHIAANCNDVETARSLIEQGADMYRLGGDLPLNCLHEAVFCGSIDIVRFLVTEVNMDKERRTGDILDSYTGIDPWRESTALEIAERQLERIEINYRRPSADQKRQIMREIIQLLKS